MKKRELSPFMIEEMLYDFATRELDSERESNVRSELEKSKVFQEELAKIQLGINYFEGLSRISLALNAVEEIRGQKTYWQILREHLSFQQWPPLLKWTLEAVSVVLVFALLTVFIPWGQIRDFVLQESQTELIITEVEKNKNRTQLSQVSLGTNDFEDEGSTLTNTLSASSGSNLVVKNPSPQTNETPQANPKVETSLALSGNSTKIPENKKQGFVFRGSIKIVNAEVGSAKIKQKIVELGGRKAGEVELGWKRNQGDYYFHFTIPESKVSEVQEYVKTLGELQISRDPHPRVMPDGIIRMIFTAEESAN
ncbi:MAG: hypothetical protein ACK5V3_17045 [Bdellovibrionales bacterium]